MDQQSTTANALTLADTIVLKKHLQKPYELIICIGEERVFCSGGQLKEYARLKKREDGLKINAQIQKNLQALEKHSALKLAFVGGDCFGGGIEFLGCFDQIYSAPECLYGFWQSRIGLSYGWGGYKRLQQKVSASFLKTALLQESLLTAYQLKTEGLITEIIPASAFAQKIEHWQNLMSGKKSKTEIQKNLDKNADAIFKKLWWTEEHRALLKARLTN